VVEIYAIDISVEGMDAWYQLLLTHASAELRSRIDMFHFAEDKKRAFFGDLLSRRLIAKRWNRSIESIEFIKDKYGKPYVKDCPNIQFNISHSGKWVVCATGNSEVGVDVEAIKQIDLDIAENFFTKRELAYIVSKPIKNRLRAFYTLWTLKESYIKYIGKGLSIPLDSFEIIEAEKEYKVIGDEENIGLWSGELSGGYIVSICHSAVEPCSPVRILNSSDLNDWYVNMKY
jgi:4'-phosphopantetheinyl transferase